MAIGDFMHKQLINAASRDALSTIGAGAAVGGGAGAVNGLLSDNDTMIGGAISGAMLGAGAGAGLRYAGNKYGAGIAAAAREGGETGKFSTSFFTKAGKDEGLDFFGDHSATMAVHREAANKTANAAPSAGSAAAQEVNQAGKAGEPPVAGPVSSGPKGTTPEALKRRKDAEAAFSGGNNNLDLKHGEAQAAWNAKRDAMKASRPARQEAAEKAAFSPNLGPVAPKGSTTLPGVSSLTGDSSSSSFSMGKKKFGSGKTTLSENMNTINNSSPAPFAFGAKTVNMDNMVSNMTLPKGVK